MEGSQNCDWIHTNYLASVQLGNLRLCSEMDTLVWSEEVTVGPGQRICSATFGWQTEQSSGAPRWWHSVTEKTGVPAGFGCCIISEKQLACCYFPFILESIDSVKQMYAIHIHIKILIKKHVYYRFISLLFWGLNNNIKSLYPNPNLILT